MKFRQGFVTNSSSSSYIVAIKKNVDKMRLIYCILSNKSLNYVLENLYDDLPENVKDVMYNGRIKEAKELLAEYLINRFLKKSSDMELGDWKIYRDKCSNETDDVLEYFLYENTETYNLDDFKIEYFY